MTASAEILSRLHDVRLPAQATAEIVADGLAGAGIGLVAAIALSVILRAFTRPQPSRVEWVRRELAAAQGLEPGQRLLVQARLVQRIAPREAPEAAEEGWRRIRAELREALYRPRPELDPDHIDAAILHAIGGHGA